MAKTKKRANSGATKKTATRPQKVNAPDRPLHKSPQAWHHLADVTGRAMQVVTHVLNSAALQSYGDCCGLDDLVKKFKTTPGRLTLTLRRLEEAGLVTLKGTEFQTLYPTVKLLREQDSRLSRADAEKIIRRLERA